MSQETNFLHPPHPLVRSANQHPPICMPPDFCNGECRKPVIYIFMELFGIPPTGTVKFFLLKSLEGKIKDKSWKCTEVIEKKLKVLKLLSFFEKEVQNKTLDEVIASEEFKALFNSCLT